MRNPALGTGCMCLFVRDLISVCCDWSDKITLVLVLLQLQGNPLSLILMVNQYIQLSIASQPQTPNQPGNSIAEMMDQTYNCSKDPRPNGVAGSLSLRKGAFLHENLSASRRKSPFVNAAYMDGLPTRQFPPHYIDQYARKIFPLLFGLFNIVYWSYYLPRR